MTGSGSSVKKRVLPTTTTGPASKLVLLYEHDEFDHLSPHLLLTPAIMPTTTHYHQVDGGSITNVWKDNLYEEFGNIRKLLGAYNFVAMDTEFPGVIAKPVGAFKSREDLIYQTVRLNVNMLSLIQLGVSLTDEQGNKPPTPTNSTWQFNFHFDIYSDMCSEQSIELLEKAGLEFGKHKKEGIKPSDFAELFISSGCVLSQHVTWITFHSCYDFGYLVKMLSGKGLPPLASDFFHVLNLYFPSIYDVKNIISKCGIYHGGLGLQKLANELEVERIGIQHQAGSDALVTGMTFFKIQKAYFGGSMDHARYNGVFGFGKDLLIGPPPPAAASTLRVIRPAAQRSLETGFEGNRTRTLPTTTAAASFHRLSSTESKLLLQTI